MPIRWMSFIRSLVIIGLLLVLVLSLPGIRGTQAAPNAALLATETFRNDTATDWSLYGSACLTAGSACATGTPISEGNGNGWLRLTSDTTSQSGSAILNTAFSSAAGLQATFTYATYGGTGSDGITFYLIDGATVSPTLGSPGGALGYSWATDYAAPGVTNGYVGIGLDELGHFSNAGFGACNPSCPTVMSSSIAVRGSGNLSTGFNFLTRADYPVSTGSRVGAKKVRITITPGTPILTVQVDSGSGFVPVITNLNLSTAIDQSALPGTFRLGLAAATGNATNYHEIRDLTVTEFDPSSTSLSTSGSPSNYGDAVTFTATVTGTSGLPTGTVIFFDGATTLGTGTLDGSGQATLSTSALIAGSHSITAWYAGDSTYAPSVSSVLAQEVNCISSYTVNNANDNGTGSLRYAIGGVCADGAITFDNNYTITLASELAIAKNLTIDGETHQIVVSGNNATRVFNVTAGNVTFAHLTIANGRTQTTDCGVLAYPCGGGIMLQNSSVAVTVTNSTLISNTATRGGGLFSYYGTVMVQASTLSGNSATANGGGLYNYLGTATVQTSTLFSNSAVGNGGGLFNYLGTMTVTNSGLISNTATVGGGGGLYNSGTVMVQTTTLSGNSAASNGGGLFNYLGTMTVMNSGLISNTATNFGGGFYNNGTLTVQSSTLSGNSATYDGGGLFNDSSGLAAVANSTLISNTARFGGGLRNLNKLTVQTSTLSGNTGVGGGGLESGGDVTIANTTFKNNIADDGTGLGTGGGFQIVSGSANLINVTFNGNEAKGASDDGGGGIMVYGGTLQLTNVTLVGNSTTSASATNGGGGISNAAGAVILTNTFVAGNTSAANKPDLSGSAASGGHNLIGSTDGSTGIVNGVNGDLAGTNALPIAALVAPLADYGGNTATMALLPDSPAIDAGDAAQCPATDQRDRARDDLRCDIGAYELTYPDSHAATLDVAPSGPFLTTFGPARAGLQYDPDAGANPGLTTITKTVGWSSGLPTGAIDAWWNIVPTTDTGLNVTLELCYRDSESNGQTLTDLRFWRLKSGTWSQVGDIPTTDRDAFGNNCATINGVTELSRWTLASSQPTAVTVRDLTAQSSAPTPWLVAGLIVMAMLVAFSGATRLIKRKRITSA